MVCQLTGLVLPQMVEFEEEWFENQQEPPDGGRTDRRFSRIEVAEGTQADFIIGMVIVSYPLLARPCLPRTSRSGVDQGFRVVRESGGLLWWGTCFKSVGQRVESWASRAWGLGLVAWGLGSGV